MSESTSLLCESLERLLSEQLTPKARADADGGQFADQLWSRVEDAGWTGLLLPEAAGGAQAGPTTMAEILKVAGRHALCVPLGETMLARQALQLAGLPDIKGPLGLSLGRYFWRMDTQAANTLLTGEDPSVRQARHCRAIVVIAGDGHSTRVAAVEPSCFNLEQGMDIAGDAVDRISASALNVEAVELAGAAARALCSNAALSRAALMCGAMEEALSLSVGYVKQRVVFGRPLGKLQAVQQQLAEAAGEVAAASAITAAAARSLEKGDSVLLLAAARARTADAADKVAGVVHQVHGAMGFTREYELHWRTRRLWAWRDEFGAAFEWRALLGNAFTGLESDALWPALATA